MTKKWVRTFVIHPDYVDNMIELYKATHTITKIKKEEKENKE